MIVGSGSHASLPQTCLLPPSTPRVLGIPTASGPLSKFVVEKGESVMVMIRHVRSSSESRKVARRRSGRWSP